MIVTDLDSTLLKSDKTISEYTISVLNRCREMGIKVVFATARSEKSSNRFSSVILPNAIISNGGTLAKCGKDIIHSHVIPKVIINKLIRLCRESEEVDYITVETKNDDFIINKPMYLNDYQHALVRDFSKDIDCDAYKVVAKINSKAAAQKIVDEFLQLKLVVSTGEKWYEFSPVEMNKWVAIQKLSMHFNILIDEIVAFGDDYNDVEMIEQCGTGVAVGNAIKEVKDVANYICDTNENDGVAKWIEQNILL